MVALVVGAGKVIASLVGVLVSSTTVLGGIANGDSRGTGTFPSR
jgi:hypothetical protein